MRTAPRSRSLGGGVAVFGGAQRNSRSGVWVSYRMQLGGTPTRWTFARLPLNRPPSQFDKNKRKQERTFRPASYLNELTDEDLVDQPVVPVSRHAADRLLF